MNPKRTIEKPIYIVSHKILWKRFKNLWDKFNENETGPIGKEMLRGKIIWEMVRDRQILLYVEDNEMCFALKLPRNRKLNIIK